MLSKVMLGSCAMSPGSRALLFGLVPAPVSDSVGANSRLPQKLAPTFSGLSEIGSGAAPTGGARAWVDFVRLQLGSSTLLVTEPALKSF
jgi:hypothetical protein